MKVQKSITGAMICFFGEESGHFELLKVRTLLDNTITHLFG